MANKGERNILKDVQKTELSALRAKYGRPDTEFIDTGSTVINELWGGGCPTGKIIEIHSDAGYGKTTLALQISGNFIKAGKPVGFMDSEHALDSPLKKSMLIDPYEHDDKDRPSFLHISPAFYSEIEEATYWLIDRGYKFLILDSLTNAVPDARSAEGGGSITNTRPGIKSAMQALYLEQFKPLLARAGATLLILNHMRTKISFVHTTLEPAGGKALQFDTDIRTAINLKGWVEEMVDGDKVKVGTELELITIKNKLTSPFRVGNVTFRFGKGTDEVETYFNLLVKKKLIVQSGAYFRVPGSDKNIQGKAPALDYVRDNIANIKEQVGETTSTLGSFKLVDHIDSLEEQEKSEFEK